MLRVECNHDGNGTLTVRLEGRLVGPYAEDARITLTRYPATNSIRVDLSDVTFADSLGEQVLSWLGRLGAEFITDNVYSRSLCERLQLRVIEKRDSFGSGTNTEVL